MRGVEMDEWTVYIETMAPQGGEDAHPDEMLERVDEMMDVLVDLSAVPSADERSWSVYVSLEVPAGQLPPTAEAGERVMEAAYKVGLPQWPVVRFEAVRSDVVDMENAKSNFPDVVGSQEVTEMLGITRQRFHELRSSGRFPEPIIHLAATPVWMRAAVTTFTSEWDRRPGRPSLAKVAADLNHIIRATRAPRR
jgi:predicted DNA-binding transcriptional regulator AlpA